ncbi:zinc finger protein 83-like [Ctenocephalides felis]|nr:zinc finger protein 83-like [Ctenocephalides felis]
MPVLDFVRKYKLSASYISIGRKTTDYSLSYRCPNCKRLFPHIDSIRNHYCRPSQSQIAFENSKDKGRISPHVLFPLLDEIENWSVRCKEKKYKCPKCPKQYSHGSALSRHVNNECGMEPKFKCDLCEYRSYRNECMQRHMRTHSKAKFGLVPGQKNTL